MAGRLQSMCSRSEREQRTIGGDLSRFEVVSQTWVDGKLQKQTSSAMAVKKYRRCAAGRGGADPLDLRSPIMLRKTMEHLVISVLGSNLPDSPGDFAELYHFLSDRFRAVRQDFILQPLECGEGRDALVETLQCQIRIHVLGLYLLQDEPLRVFDAKLAASQLVQCLSTLLEVYCDAVAKGDEWFQSSALGVVAAGEFFGYELLLSLGAGETGGTMRLLQHLPTDVLQSAEVRLALRLLRLCQSGSFYAIGRTATASSTPVLVKCLLSRLMPALQRRALVALNRAFISREPFNLAKAARWLGSCGAADERSIAAICAACGLRVSDEDASCQRCITFTGKTVAVPPLPPAAAEPGDRHTWHFEGLELCKLVQYALLGRAVALSSSIS